VSAALLLGAADAVMATRVRQLAAELGLEVEDAEALHASPAVVVVNLDDPQAAALVGEWRARWPEAVLAAYVGMPDPEKWVAAQRAGCDLVTNRGAFVAKLRALLAGPGRQQQRRFPLLNAADSAGRLGLVARIDETPVGPVAVYRAAGRLCAVRDNCPHAGGVLSRGELDGTVVTCPEHGSQFDVTTGERVRGPADVDVETYRVVQDDGQIWLIMPTG
jgi:nitrite reductase/ring-hydroxylating ferredoxin subunit